MSSKLKEREEELIKAFSDSYASDKLKAFAATALVHKFGFSRDIARKCVASDIDTRAVLKAFAEENAAFDLGMEALLDEIALIIRVKDLINELVYNFFD